MYRDVDLFFHAGKLLNYRRISAATTITKHPFISTEEIADKVFNLGRCTAEWPLWFFEAIAIAAAIESQRIGE